MLENVVCVIPARGGSKGIEKKNLQMLGSQPLFMHSVIHALAAGIPKKQVVVSSDDNEILQVAKDAWVNIRQRPAEISGDLASTETCLIDVIENVPEVKHCDAIVTLQPTSPIRASGRIRDAIKCFYSGDYDSLLTVTKFYDFLWFQKEEQGRWYSSYNPRNRPMRQELGVGGVKHFDNGNIYITDVEWLLETRCRLGDKIFVYPVTELEGVQIDTMNELNAVRQVFDGLSSRRLTLDGLQPDELYDEEMQCSSRSGVCPSG